MGLLSMPISALKAKYRKPAPFGTVLRAYLWTIIGFSSTAYIKD